MMKRISALVLATALAFACSVPAMAAGIQSPRPAAQAQSAGHPGKRHHRRHRRHHHSRKAAMKSSGAQRHENNGASGK